MTFISNCLAGKAFMDEIDDYVARWHSGLAGKNQELHEFLGMSWEEYSLWRHDLASFQPLLIAKYGILVWMKS